jgi:glycerol uptake operon antiterminator
MHFGGQQILPAIKKMKDFEKVLHSPLEYIVLLDVHLAQLEGIVKMAKAHNKKICLHADLIQGLKTDSYSAEFLCQRIKPYAIISTRSDMLATAKKQRIIAIQRIFLIDTLAIETSYKLTVKVQPDYIEVLPGVVPDFIKQVRQTTGVPVIAGGLIHYEAEVSSALNAGAVAVTTSKHALWKN